MRRAHDGRPQLTATRLPRATTGTASAVAIGWPCDACRAVTVWSDPNVRQFVRFAIVGAVQNGTNLALFAIALALEVPLVPAALLAAAGALALSFALNRRWTFPGTGDRTTGRAVRYVAVWLGFLAVALPTLVVLVKVAHIPRLAAQALIICVGAPLSYLIQRRWTFGPPSPRWWRLASQRVPPSPSASLPASDPPPTPLYEAERPDEHGGDRAAHVGGRARCARAVRSALARVAAHGHIAALVLAAVTGAVVFAPRIKAGGCWSTIGRWTRPSTFQGPRLQLRVGGTRKGSGLSHRGGPVLAGRFTLFGSHTKFYLLLAGGLAVLLAFSIYLLLRELRFPIWQSMAIMVLTLVAPSLATARFWFTPSGSQISLMVFFLGLTLALRASRDRPLQASPARGVMAAVCRERDLCGSRAPADSRGAPRISHAGAAPRESASLGLRRPDRHRRVSRHEPIRERNERFRADPDLHVGRSCPPAGRPGV